MAAPLNGINCLNLKKINTYTGKKSKKNYRWVAISRMFYEFPTDLKDHMYLKCLAIENLAVLYLKESLPLIRDR